MTGSEIERSGREEKANNNKNKKKEKKTKKERKRKRKIERRREAKKGKHWSHLVRGNGCCSGNAAGRILGRQLIVYFMEFDCRLQRTSSAIHRLWPLRL